MELLLGRALHVSLRLEVGVDRRQHWRDYALPKTLDLEGLCVVTRLQSAKKRVGVGGEGEKLN